MVYKKSIESKDKTMQFLKSDLSRNFAIGFFLGALIVAFQISPDLGSQLLPEAVAATIR